MKKPIKYAISILGAFLALIIVFWLCFHYESNYKKTVCDTSVSTDGRYELTLLAVGEPDWPFGSTSGQLVLKEGNAQISQTDFELKNDGGSISSRCWAVDWNETFVEVILSGEEQYDEQIILYFDGTILTDETESAAEQPEIEVPDIEVRENRENELVFTISIDDYISSYNSYYELDYGRRYLAQSSEWQCYTYDSAIHSEHETLFYYFTEDKRVYSLPTIAVYAPTNGNYIQEITINFDDHSYTESGYKQYKQMCFYTLKVFFPNLSDETILDLCTEAITLGNQNVFTSDEWYDSDSVPCALFYKDGVGVYPYFAIGDWERLCIIPVTEETIAEFEQKGVEIHEIE